MTPLTRRFRLDRARYSEVDALRGLAIVLMVAYHFTWDLSYYGVIDVSMTTFPLSWAARGIATLFIMAMSISLVISTNRARAARGRAGVSAKVFRRGATIFGYGLLVTAATYVFLGGEGYVVFGILHALGLSTMVAVPFIDGSRRWSALAVGLALIGAGGYVATLASESPWLIWLGVKQYGRSMVDYYPALPWVGVTLVALSVANILYPRGRRRFAVPVGYENPVIRGLAHFGQHSLLIYLVHQPLLIGLLIVSGVARD